jgi:predicted KAP-like P-loop ATPase
MKDAKIDNNIRVFVDEPIGNINDDEFGHRHYVDVIKNIIDNCQNEQLNIGLFGKWGVGKTTIINLLKNRIDNSKEYKTVMFECWKYSNEPISLKRKFLLEVAKQTGEPVDELIESLYIKGNRQINNQSILKSESNLKKSIKGMFKGLLFSSVIILFAEVIFYLFLLSRLHIEGQISIPLFFNAIVAGVIYYVVKILKDYTSNVTITKSNENLESLEQFEKSFQKLINDFANKKSNKIIIFVDDLDRCQSKKVIEVLETIKTFMNIKKCIFIIACDDAVLKKALIEEKIDDTDYLDKIFQIKLAIPPFRQEKIRDFTIKLLSSIDIDIPKEELKEIVHVLIYKNVMSPRKVKILLNNFILLYGIFKERLQENYFSANFTLDLKFLAKITVLQTEFTQLYYDLVNNNRLLEYVEEIMTLKSPKLIF